LNSCMKPCHAVVIASITFDPSQARLLALAGVV